MYDLRKISEITGGKIFGRGSSVCSEYLTDSRQLVQPDKAVFFALVSSRNNGHLYIQSLLEKGVRSFVISESAFAPDLHQYPDASYVLVEDALIALQLLAAFHRNCYQIPVIGITGSNGKTMVKEWLYQLLKPEHAICRSPKSYNSQIGVPLSVLNLKEQHTLAIFEAGISLPGEMANLQNIIRPTIGVFTSFGEAHDKGFQSREQKFSEKSVLFRDCEKVIWNKTGIEFLMLPKQQNLVTIGATEDCDYVATFETRSDDTSIQLVSANCSFTFCLPFTDRASVLNAMTCAVVLKQLGYAEDVIRNRMLLLQPLAIRLEVKNAVYQSVLINDFYNSDMDSVRIALAFLDQQHRREKKILIISDIEQSGRSDEELYKELSMLVSRYQIQLMVGIGKRVSACRELFSGRMLFYDDVNSFIHSFSSINPEFHHATILLKGASSFQFDRISSILQLKSHDTVLEVNLEKLVHNVNYYRSLLSGHTMLMCMVKAMGYGTGSTEIATSLQHHGVNYLAVAYADEGVELRQANIHLPIMVMSPEQDSFEDIIKYRLEPEIYSMRILEMFVAALERVGYPGSFPVHIKLDTGMKRLGFEAGEADALLDKLKRTPQIYVKSVFSHLVASDNAGLDDFSENQILQFETFTSILKHGLGYSFIRHICNSGGISRFKNAHYDMVRLGIGMYGFGINATENRQLENVCVLKTRISQIKKVSAGETVGYNRKGVVKTDSVIATIPIGYADGFHRSLGNGAGSVYINGSYCKTIGNICMDMCMIDISGINCKEGDEVIVFETGEQVNALAEAMSSIAYEVLSNISSRVKRVYIQE